MKFIIVLAVLYHLLLITHGLDQSRVPTGPLIAQSCDFYYSVEQDLVFILDGFIVMYSPNGTFVTLESIAPRPFYCSPICLTVNEYTKQILLTTKCNQLRIFNYTKFSVKFVGKIKPYDKVKTVWSLVRIKENTSQFYYVENVDGNLVISHYNNMDKTCGLVLAGAANEISQVALLNGQLFIGGSIFLGVRTIIAIDEQCQIAGHIPLQSVNPINAFIMINTTHLAVDQGELDIYTLEGQRELSLKFQENMNSIKLYSKDRLHYLYNMLTPGDVQISMSDASGKVIIDKIYQSGKFVVHNDYFYTEDNQVFVTSMNSKVKVWIQKNIIAQPEVVI